MVDINLSQSNNKGQERKKYSRNVGTMLYMSPEQVQFYDYVIYMYDSRITSKEADNLLLKHFK